MPGGKYGDFVRQIDFELIRPDTRRGPDGRFTLERQRGSKATVLELPGVPIDPLNTKVGPDAAELRRRLRTVCDVPRMGTFAIGSILNQGVQRLAPNEAFVNVGIWNGFSFLCGLAGNPDRRCIGIDNYSELVRRPREAFKARFEERKGPAHEFFDMDYEDYFATRHRDPIGLYFYDGDHAYEHQLRGLEIAEPFFSEDCVVLVDDSNWDAPRDATLDFIARSERDYEVLLDARTIGGSHPTWWNGMIVFRATGEGAGRDAEPAHPDPRPALEPNGIDFASRSTLVSVIVCNPEGAGEALQATIRTARAQTWPSTEVVVAEGGENGLRDAFEASEGAFVALVDAREAAFDESSVELGLTLPELSRFNLGGLDGAHAGWLQRAFAAAADVAEAIPADARFVLAGTREHTAKTLETERAIPFFVPGAGMQALDDPGAIARLEELRAQGARYAVFLLGTFGWLGQHSGLEEHLRTSARAVLENDRVRVFELDGGGAS